MQHYELLYILPISVPEESMPEVEQSVQHIITDVSGKVDQQDKIGKKKLAFPIKHARYGIYVNLLFEASVQAIAEIQRRMRLRQDVLRFLITEYDLETHQREAERQQKSREYKARVAQMAPVVPVVPSLSSPTQSSVKQAPSQTFVQQEPSKEKQVPVNLEELSKKLDKILDDDMLK
ncbi:MAG: 30S ribosomal protein S6 [Candidatus Kerfeldbacteria bacterium RIFCSPHIGHO2_02_FULL_42_14]|uniref:Small ribosomal subunit protein bS6 n=1 Tax=Candidatus Kerfeldbacteria bacterium RIFCSPHIGHO2_02_FULL_42_14 TaxID=1798540 RepID=A0A1G2AR77_9BACT|nr:MAG: 30S ribosomal protein S6 [Candidatus Kerfeldbacteria bacterium RIFCSPHIGHO2_02_FULL_42_14]OGY81940.1 MAG: 30S ribosomal protein S6 [Candidatus Kerfeldbacteria bacterium RIFCSPHIGHO2_12_FULL_42_13]OGY83425.1 MAG: 30S ribosomal protein S6 [Candidatus Kerfeldbacteria bacterium RIFCSPLOWO2_02_FULL_42_19]OGY85565.1 MAG: 30S ribosomal protein S6 [Candidatus Kerfeldbacteria bacterium RIFCSPLOWO2_12_FULL_43_9]